MINFLRPHHHRRLAWVAWLASSRWQRERHPDVDKYLEAVLCVSQANVLNVFGQLHDLISSLRVLVTLLGKHQLPIHTLSKSRNLMHDSR